ncbi:MAG TPA: CDP-diacylglycerol--glycerol-3-phosphate 3-phosphatidyltransferase [Longimicrobiales bacterium]|nr:CDP-diacylglycerol--glycerol-3-phosphate 3-phosphatidyltransferase [Longimicrobiales bacterium]
MSVLERSTLPNVITVGRILMAPAVFFLILAPGFWDLLVCFTLFIIAAVSDLWDGHLARKYGWVSDFGKLADPIADKLLLVATFVPFYILSHRPGPLGELPVWGTLPLWVVLVVLGREVLITALRTWAARHGQVLAAGRAGKHKAVVQNVFVGSAILWYALRSRALEHHWAGSLWESWRVLHGSVLAASLAVAVILTLYSMVVYLRSWRVLVRGTG